MIQVVSYFAKALDIEASLKLVVLCLQRTTSFGVTTRICSLPGNSQRRLLGATYLSHWQDILSLTVNDEVMISTL